MKENGYRKRVGSFGEMLVVTYLENMKYEIIDRNFFTKYGEIDIIAKDKEEYVFIEVKTRKSFKYGSPAEAIDLRKKQHIQKASNIYVYLNKLENKCIRYDIIEVCFMNKNKYYINHLKNNFF